MNDVLTLSLDLISGALAQEEPRQTGPDFGKASPFGFIVVLLLLIGVFVLVWSMNRHLQRLPESFDNDKPDGPDEAGENSTDGTNRELG